MNSVVKISVIIPVYNAATYIGRCAQSLFEQTLGDIEYIFIDDCSPDDSITVLEQVLVNYPTRIAHVRIIRHHENKGVATARNTGLDAAKGKYIGWVDADDWVEPEMFEKMYNRAESEHADIVWTDFYNTYQNTENRISQKNELGAVSCIKAMLDGRLIGGLCNKLVRKSMFAESNIRFPDGLNMCEDLLVSIQLLYHAKGIVYIDDSCYHYIKHKPDSISTVNITKPNVNMEWIENLKTIEQFLKQKGLSEELEENLTKRKLSPKKNLLVKGNTVECYRQWKNIFPESNGYIWQTNLPVYYKILGWCADKKLWPIIQLWIWLKYRLKAN